MANFDTSVNSYSNRDRFRRSSQRDVLPGAIKARSLSSFIFGSTTESASTSLGNGDQAVITFDLDQNDDFELLAVNYIALYVGSVSDANQLPGGSGIDESQWQIIGPMYDYDNWEDTNFSASKERMSLYVRNISAGSVTLLIRGKWRYLSPREGGTT